MRKIILSIVSFVIALNVFANTGDPNNPNTWIVTANDYQYSMTVTSVLVFDLDESRDMNDKIAAFVGNDCRGVAKPITYIPSDDRYIANLIIYSNLTNGEELTIYMYDASEDKIVEVAEKLMFSANATYGRPNDPFYSLTTHNVDILVNAANQPVENATVSLGTYGEILTGADGMAHFEAIQPSDSLYYSVMADGYDLYEDTFALINTAVIKIVDLTLSKTFVITDENNLPLDSALVVLEGYEAQVTNELGEALFTGITPLMELDYTITCSDYDEYRGTTVMQLPTLQKEKVELILTTYTVKFNIIDGQQPVENGIITLEGYGSAVTDTSGQATFNNILPNDHIPFTVTATNFDLFEGSVSVLQNQNLTIDLNLTTFNVTINVINGELPIENAKVTLEGYGNQNTDVFGNAIFKDVLIDSEINYAVTSDAFHSAAGSVSVLNKNVEQKVTLNYKMYNVTFNINDGINPVKGSLVSLQLPGEYNVEDLNSFTLPNYISTSGNNSWIVDTSNVFMGIYSMKSGPIYDNQFTKVEFQKLTQSGTFSFYMNTSSEEGLDFLVFYIDGIEKGRWSGDTGWKHIEYQLEEGNHVFKWEYKKDGSRSTGKDCAWIDYIKFPSESMYTQTQETDVSGTTTFTNLLPQNKKLKYEITDTRYNNITDSISILDKNVTQTISLNIDLVFKVNKELNRGFTSKDSIILQDNNSARINDEGIAIFRNVQPAESLNFSIVCEGYNTLEDEIVALYTDTIVRDISITRYNVTFNLTYNNSPVSDLMVTLGEYGSVITGNDGIADFTEIIPGELSYSIENENYRAVVGECEVIDKDLTINLEIFPEYYVYFNIQSDNITGNIPVRNALIELITIERIASTNDNGEAVFDKIIPNENIAFKVEAEGYKSITGEFSVIDQDVVQSVTLIMNPELDAANIVTPNGDGKNDYWEIINPEKYAEFRVRIFTLSGVNIYETKNYESNKWDGTNNGNSLPKGIYYYIMNSPDGSIIYKGIINLIY